MTWATPHVGGLGASQEGPWTLEPASDPQYAPLEVVVQVEVVGVVAFWVLAQVVVVVGSSDRMVRVQTLAVQWAEVLGQCPKCLSTAQKGWPSSSR